MLTGRGVAVVTGALLLWLAARILGAPDLHMAAVGLLALVPLATALVRWSRPGLQATRRPSARRAFPGTRIRVDVEVRNTGRAATSVLLVEDRLPPALGRAARAALAGIPPGGRTSVSYTLVPRARGRYRIGPLTCHLGDPFGLARRGVELPGRHELIVYPEVEDLRPGRPGAAGPGSGESSTRRLFSAGEELYAIRPYETGDDLRRIHWPSTARAGRLMIRQDEAAERQTLVLYLDTRVSSVGGRAQTLERAVSAAASIGSHYLRAGFGLRLSTTDLPPRTLGRDEFLEVLAVVAPSRVRPLAPSLSRLGRAGAGLAVVTHLPTPEEAATLSAAAGGFAPRVAVLVYPEDPGRLPARRRAEVAAWADAARTSLVRSGWTVLLLSPAGRLRDAWQPTSAKRATAASW